MNVNGNTVTDKSDAHSLADTAVCLVIPCHAYEMHAAVQWIDSLLNICRTC